MSVFHHLLISMCAALVLLVESGRLIYVPLTNVKEFTILLSIPSHMVILVVTAVMLCYIFL
jgi:hypothetical protein